MQRISASRVRQKERLHQPEFLPRGLPFLCCRIHWMGSSMTLQLSLSCATSQSEACADEERGRLLVISAEIALALRAPPPSGRLIGSLRLTQERRASQAPLGLRRNRANARTKERERAIVAQSELSEAGRFWQLRKPPIDRSQSPSRLDNRECFLFHRILVTANL